LNRNEIGGYAYYRACCQGYWLKYYLIYMCDMEAFCCKVEILSNTRSAPTFTTNCVG